jgi:hypothetical protein
MPLGIVKDEDYNKELGVVPNVSTNDTTDVPKPEEVFPNDLPSETSGSDEQCSTPNVLAEVIHIDKGRGKGNTEVPQGIRKIIGEAVIEEGRPAGLAIAQFLGISDSSVAAYSKGATSTATYNKPDKDLKDFLGETRKRISKRAAGKLMKSLREIKDSKLQDLTALEASNVAKNMAAIIKNMEPPSDRNGVNINMPTITLYAPQMAHESEFNVVHVHE